MRETVCEVTVVRQEERAGRVRIEASHRNDARRMRDDVDHGATALRVSCSRDDAGGLVEQDVRNALLGEQPAVEANVVVRADESVQLPWLSVDGDPPGLDQVVGLPPRGDSGARDERVQARGYGTMLWLWWKTLSGSTRRFSATSRS